MLLTVKRGAGAFFVNRGCQDDIDKFRVLFYWLELVISSRISSGLSPAFEDEDNKELSIFSYHKYSGISGDRLADK